MKQLLLFIFSVLLLNSACTQKSCYKCDIEKVKIANAHTNNLTLEHIKDFLCTFDETCKSNSEYSEWSNETLFKVIDKAPALFLNAVNTSQINKQAIVKELENPVHDEIDIQKSYDKLKEVNIAKELKSEYLKALITSGKKRNTNIKL